MTPAKILVVDDDSRIRKLLRLFLTRCGYDVATCSDGAEALQHLAGELPQLIITDVHMPNLNGHELVRQLGANRASAQIPVIMISAHGADPDGQSCPEAARVCLAKPVDLADLARHIEGLLQP